MFNLTLLCFFTVTFFGVCGMLGYVLSRYQRLLAEHEKLRGEMENRQGEK